MINRTWPSRRRRFNLILTAGGNLLCRYRFRTTVVILSLAAILFPFLTVVSISEGIKFESQISLLEGADFYVAGDAAGRNAPLPLSALERFIKLPAVARVVPRIVGRAYLKEKIVTVVGMSAESAPGGDTILEQGRFIREPGEVLVGAALAKKYGLVPGTQFYLPINKWKRFTVVGVFDAGCSLWSSRLIYMDLHDAGALFRMGDTASDFMVYAEPGENAVVNIQLQLENQTDPPFRIQSRELANAYLQKGFDSRAGVFTAFYLVAFALAVPIVAILAGLGWGERKKEIGTLKASGWQAFDVLNVVLWENVFISLTAACLALAAVLLWLKVFNGFFIAPFFLGEADLIPDFPIPFRIVPVSVFLAFLVTLTLTLTGSLYNTWRLATTPAGETVRQP